MRRPGWPARPACHPAYAKPIGFLAEDAGEPSARAVSSALPGRVDEARRVPHVASHEVIGTRLDELAVERLRGALELVQLAGDLEGRLVLDVGVDGARLERGFRAFAIDDRRSYRPTSGKPQTIPVVTLRDTWGRVRLGG